MLPNKCCNMVLSEMRIDAVPFIPFYSVILFRGRYGCNKIVHAVSVNDILKDGVYYTMFVTILIGLIAFKFNFYICTDMYNINVIIWNHNFYFI